MPHIACLHTADSNVELFDAALRELEPAGVTLSHIVRADLLVAAEAAGGLTPTIAEQTAEALRGVCAGADAVLLTCSTLGPAAEAAAGASPVPILRVDAALAHEAVADGGKVAVLCAVETTVEPTRLLFEKAARATGAEIAVQLVPGAWAAFKAGKRDAYLAAIAHAADQASRDGADRVVLAQASMAGATALSAVERRPLTSPKAGLQAAIQAAS